MKFKVAAASLNQTPLAWESNRQHILKAIAEAQQRGVKLLCFPELCISGYGCEDTFLSKETARLAFQVLEEILPYTKNIAVALGLPLLFQKNLYNVACFINDCKIQGFVAKQNLAGYGVHYEQRWFKPWPAGQVVETIHSSNQYPLGDLVFDWQEIKIGFEICEDAWVAERTGRSLAKRNVDLILNPSASHFAFGKSKIRKAFILHATNHFGVGYLYANLLGNEAGRLIYDGDTIIAANTEILAEGPRFSFQDYVLTEADLDIQAIRDYRASSLRHAVNPEKDSRNTAKEGGALQTSEVQQKSEAQQKSEVQQNSYQPKTRALFEQGPNWEHSPHIKEEELLRSVSLGLFDYLRKSKVQGFVLNLSGGVDSASCACLVYYMVHLGIQDLGIKGFLDRLQFIPGLKSLAVHPDLMVGKSDLSAEKVDKPAEAIGLTENLDLNTHLIIPIMQHLLFCLYQGTVQNSAASREAARALSQTISCSFAEIEVDGLVENYTQLISGVIKRAINWKNDDIALQNIQARVRSPSIWLLANLRQSLVICASNRSEASTGYTTMDGDTAGGLCPLAGVDKQFLIQWLNWLGKEGPIGIGGLPVLQKVLGLSPSAELKPLNEAQKDEEDLMPFAWIDYFERLYVRDKLSKDEILAIAQKKFSDIQPNILKAALERFLELWRVSQWKRERLAPSFHLDDESVDPKTWCRFPILSGPH